MDSIEVRGGIRLQGKVKVQGSKNAALPILAATLLNKGMTVLYNCPRISDVYAMIELLRNLGCQIHWQGNGLYVDTSKACVCEMNTEAVKGMRSSLCLLGAMLGRCGEVLMEYPGGCVIGARPIDIHLDALHSMGADFTTDDGILRAKAEKLRGTDIIMLKKSVGATENVILAAVAAEGTTVIHGAAQEPEVVALCDYLNCCGAQILGAGTEQITIISGEKDEKNILCREIEYRIPSDRIVAGTYMLACVGTGGNILLEDAPVSDMQAVMQLCMKMGANMYASEEGLYIQGPFRPEAATFIQTESFPGFPTDLQSLALVVGTIADGDTVIEENIFENRYRIVPELRKMGAVIDRIDEKRVLVHGIKALRGAEVVTGELRGGAALVVAGILASGKTTVKNCSYIYRGYESISRDFSELGARIVSV